MAEKDEIQDYVSSLKQEYPTDSYWTHYKGGVYKIITVAVKEDSLEPVIVYQSLKHGTVWVRTVKNFASQVTLQDGPNTMVQRFKKGAP
jgi:hypothetical protein